jgi:hypothetical protein
MARFNTTITDAIKAFTRAATHLFIEQSQTAAEVEHRRAYHAKLRERLEARRRARGA